jgi:acetamidase/formamidase
VRLAPFLGVLGMPPAERGIHSTRPPRPTGGNIDCKELVAGTTLFLPIAVDGALLSAGDGHGAQGDGEVSGWAIECPVEGRLTLDLRDDLELAWPIARASDAWLSFGFDEDLARAARIALDGMLDLMERERGIPRDEALVLASVAVDLRVTQIVNLAVGVHAVLRDDALG